MGVGVIGLETDGLVVFGLSLAWLALAFECIAEVIMGVGQIGLETDGLVVFGLSLA